MKQRAKIIAVVLVLLLAAASSCLGQEIKKDAVPAYLLTIFLGFGTGHFYLQDKAAVPFLLLNIATYGVAVGGAVVAIAAMYSMDQYSYAYGMEMPAQVTTGLMLALVGSLAYLAVHIWEIVDVILTVNEMRAAGKITMRPAVELALGNTRIGVALSY